MLDRQKYEQILRNILRDIYTTPQLQGRLIFKGGTCLYLFYGLDRFSVDLDFNLVSADFDDKQITDILSKYLSLDDHMQKYFTWFWLGSYEKGKQRIKVEISKRDYPDTFVNKDFYGITIPTMAPDCMFAHKLCAITDRKKLQNRDIYDAHFMFTKQFPIKEEIIKIRTGKTRKEYFTVLIDYIEKNMKPSTSLDGLGELLNDQQKDSVKASLQRNILFDLRSYNQ
jgi:predicted nucleotidyltransferase component of viral defense system